MIYSVATSVLTTLTSRIAVSLILLTGFVSSANAGPTGEELYNEVLETSSVYQGEELNAYINDLGEQIVAVSEMRGEKFTFTIIDAPVINAFATRDNYVYINRGLLNYIRNEAQLVSVLSHEVGHVTQGHVTGQETKSMGAQSLAMVAAVLSGSMEVYEAGMAYSNSLIRSHGRSNELEADQVGAEYMARLGFDPREMIGMLSIMKDNEALQKKRAAAKGAPKQTYHGIFSSHPRNDSRLRSVVTQANAVKSDQSRGTNEVHYRQMTEGLIWGENFLAKETPPERYSNLNWKVRIDFPEEWDHGLDAQGVAVIGEPESKDARLTMIRSARTAQGPEEYLYNYLDVPQLRDGEDIKPGGLKGFSGILPGENGNPDSRIAVVYYKLSAYIFTGEAKEVEDFSEYDELFMESISTFRTISSREIAGQKPTKIHYVKATTATTFDALAKALNLNQTELEDLRMINGYYPAGEPTAGDWIKIFKQ
jgi:predicted Zn-dependent protease